MQLPPIMSKESLDDKLYWYKVRVDFLYDGDSITALQLNFGFGLSKTVSRGDSDGIRFYGLNAPELNTPEGKELRDFLKPLEGEYIYVRSIRDKKGKYGRYLFVLYVRDNLLNGEESLGNYMNLNDYMIWKGLAPKAEY